jgi:hypothetical protein
MGKDVILQHAILIKMMVAGITTVVFEAFPCDIEITVKISQAKVAKYMPTDIV